MIKVFFLIFESELAWQKLAFARNGATKIVLFHLLPMMLIAGWVEGLGLLHWGRLDRETFRVITFTRNYVLFFEAVQLVLGLIAVFIAAWLVRIMAGAFLARRSFAQLFGLIAYSLSPLYLFRLADALPQMYPWMSWGAGIALSVWIMYQGLPPMLKPDPTGAFGLYCTAMISVVSMTGLARAMTAQLLASLPHLKHPWDTWLAAGHF